MTALDLGTTPDTWTLVRRRALAAHAVRERGASRSSERRIA